MFIIIELCESNNRKFIKKEGFVCVIDSISELNGKISNKHQLGKHTNDISILCTFFFDNSLLNKIAKTYH